MKYLILLILLTNGCASQPTPAIKKKILRQRLTMGTVISVQLQNKNRSQFEPIFEIFNQLDQKLSTYKKKSEVSLLNLGQKVSLSDDTASLFDKAQKLQKISQGHFNIFTGKQTFLYRKNKVNLYLKPMALNSKHKFNLSNNSLKLKPGHQIDFGGIAKGYAVDKSLAYLKSINIDTAQVSASGDIGCLGPCTLFIQNPVNESPMLEILSSQKRLAVSTSANYRRQTLSHIINPIVGRFVNHWLSITLIDTQNNTQLDGLTTAVFSMSREKAYQFLKKNKVHYIIVDNDKNLILSKQLHLVIDEVRLLNTKDLKTKNKLAVKAN